MIGAVLSGGRNTRFPYQKGFVKIEGTTIIERNLELLRSVTEEVVISANEPERYFRLGVPIIGDVVEPGGPMAGIYSVLKCTGAGAAIVVACDMPFINRELLIYIVEEMAGDAAVPVYGGRPEPLLAVYSRGALGAMEEMLLGGKRAMTGLLERIDVRYIDEDEVRKIDPGGRSFININTVEDLEKVLEENK